MIDNLVLETEGSSFLIPFRGGRQGLLLSGFLVYSGLDLNLWSQPSFCIPCFDLNVISYFPKMRRIIVHWFSG
jgi:hypothetical protein